jgi:hypothetical protein
MTHISIDLYDSSAYLWQRSITTGKHLYDESKKQVQKGTEKATNVYKDQMDKHWPTIKPHYEEHIVGNFQKHVAPHLEEHVYPRLSQLSKWYQREIVPRFQQCVRTVQQHYRRMTRLYGEECRSSLKAYKQASKENDFFKEYPLPQSVLQTWTNSCSHPEETMDSAINGLLLLLGIIFYRRILDVVWWTLHLLLAILVMFTPLRFFVSHKNSKLKKGSPVLEDGDDDDEVAIPNIVPSSSGSPDSIKNPGGPYKSNRSAKKP